MGPDKTSGPGRGDPDRLIWRRRPVTGVFLGKFVMQLAQGSHRVLKES
jgi:hypothetical protein